MVQTLESQLLVVQQDVFCNNNHTLAKQKSKKKKKKHIQKQLQATENSTGKKSSQAPTVIDMPTREHASLTSSSDDYLLIFLDRTMTDLQSLPPQRPPLHLQLVNQMWKTFRLNLHQIVTKTMAVKGLILITIQRLRMMLIMHPGFQVVACQMLTVKKRKNVTEYQLLWLAECITLRPLP